MNSSHVLAQKFDDENHIVVNRTLKICINCGYDEVDKTEFSLSCENCGTTMFFE
ncbi:hypothetical protein [Nitrosopumilus sp. b1]|uniref:hypothetical protein n=1 Tax=Nitrosopumilus sp. b1 TaxID=2109907 RepID=UPI0015F50824|nr:hypothetical protein [Nitrosopumilus sp. b1]